LHLVLDPSGNPYESVRDDNRMGKDFRRLNDKVVAAGGRRLILRQLRHSAINHALDCGATIEGVKSATAHASDRTLQIYVRRSEKRAVQVQKLRGIV
jgi:integrase